MSGRHHPQINPGTYNSPSFIARIDGVWKGKDAADPRRDVGTVISRIVNVVKLSDQVQLEAPIPDGFAPDLIGTRE